MVSFLLIVSISSSPFFNKISITYIFCYTLDMILVLPRFNVCLWCKILSTWILCTAWLLIGGHRTPVYSGNTIITCNYIINFSLVVSFGLHQLHSLWEAPSKKDFTAYIVSYWRNCSGVLSRALRFLYPSSFRFDSAFSSVLLNLALISPMSKFYLVGDFFIGMKINSTI